MRWVVMLLVCLGVVVRFDNAYAETQEYTVSLSVECDVSSVAKMCEGEIKKALGSKMKLKYVPDNQGHFMRIDVAIIQQQSGDRIIGYSMAHVESVRHIGVAMHTSTCKELYDYLIKDDTPQVYMHPAFGVYVSPDKKILSAQCKEIGDGVYSGIIKPWEDGWAAMLNKK